MRGKVLYLGCPPGSTTTGQPACIVCEAGKMKAQQLLISPYTGRVQIRRRIVAVNAKELAGRKLLDKLVDLTGAFATSFVLVYVSAS